MKIGITGTREGMNASQRERVEQLLIVLFADAGSESELHHGDCVGVDIQVAEIAQSWKYKTVCHPPSLTELRAYHQSDEMREPLNYLARDRKIVEETEVLIVVPLHNEPQKSGGTWYTHDYAVKLNKPRIIVYPNKEGLDF